MTSDDTEARTTRDEITISDKARAGIGPDSGVRPEQVTLGPLEREMGETVEQSAPRRSEHTVAGGDDLTADERERQGIIDESRHTNSLGTR